MLLLLVEGLDYQTCEQSHDEERADQDENHEERRHIGRVLVPRDKVHPTAIDAVEHGCGPVDQLTHHHHLVHGAANIVEIVVFHGPPPMIMQTVLLRVDLLLNFTQ